MPIFVVSIMAHDEKRTKEAFMKQSEQIIQIQAARYNEKDQEQKERLRMRLFEHLNNEPVVRNWFHRTEASGIIASGEHMRYVHYMYVDQSFNQNFNQFVQEGQWFNPLKTNECIIGTELSKRLWRDSGVQAQLLLNNKQCNVIGTTEIFPYWVVLLHQTDENWSGFSKFYVRLNDSHAVGQVISSIKQLSLNLEVESVDLLNKEYLDGQHANYRLMLLITLSVFVYAIINISNVIKFMLDERKGRYGIQIAMGSTKASIVLEFFIELLMITSISLIAVLGILHFNTPLIERFIISIQIDGWVVASTIVTNIIICGFLSILYLRRILSKDVISLMRGDR